MEEKGQNKMTQEDILKEIQAQENLENQQDEEYDEEMDQESTKIYEEINLQNIKMFIAKATSLKLQKKYEEACMILKLIIQKCSGLLGNALHFDLATVYYLMGDFLLERNENSNDIFNSAPEPTKETIEEGGEDKQKSSAQNNPSIDYDEVQIAWENLDVARVIIQNKINAGEAKEEERNKLIRKLALIHNRLGSCELWQDNFIKAVEEFSKTLALQESILDPARSREVAETLYTIGNTMCYMQASESDQVGYKPDLFFKRAAAIFENLISDEYEKKGLPFSSCKEDKFGIKAGLALLTEADKGQIKELKLILKSIHQKIRDCHEESEVQKLMKQEEERKKENEKNIAQLSKINAFGKPINSKDDDGKPKQAVKFLGTFGKKAKNQKKENKQKLKDSIFMRKRNKPSGPDLNKDSSLTKVLKKGKPSE